MNLRPRRPAPPDINLAPLIDVVFLLLIFFMVSTTFQEDTGLQIDLPRAEGEPALVEELNVLTIEIDRVGGFHVTDQRLDGDSPAHLERAVRAGLGDALERPVLIKADAQTPHQAVMTALDVLGRIGLVRIQFAAVRPAEPVSADSAP